MYLPASFEVNDRAILLEIMHRHTFATVVGVLDGEPEIAHLPTLAKDAPLRVCGHVARSNPMARMVEAGAPLTAVFHGPHAYISPRFYATTPNLPTWNYVVVHARGPTRVLPDAMAHLRELVGLHENGGWPLDDDYAHKMVRGVVAFEISVERLQGKLKLNQNRKPEDWAAVVKHFEDTEPEMVSLMKRLGPPRAR